MSNTHLDSNEILSLIRARIADIEEGTEDMSKWDAVDQLAELVLSLDDLLQAGGSLPAEWEHNTTQTREMK